MRAITIHEYGPPEVLRLEEVPDPHPGPDEVVIETEAIGIVYAETQVRAGKMARFGLAHAQFPYTFGRDVAGRVVAVGPGVDTRLIGTRVAASTKGGIGGYAERAIVAASTPKVAGAVWSCIVPIPEGLGYDDAVALMGQGRTALALIRTARLEPGASVLVTAAAGAVGHLLVQLARAAGAGTIVAAARGETKLQAARQAGADVVVDYTDEGWVEAVKEATGGGADLVFDAVGGAIARGAYDAARNGGGTIVIYGLASGRLEELPADELLARGITLLGFSGARYMHLPEWVLELQTEILELAAAGGIKPAIGRTFPLEQAAAAHAALEAREVVGKALLIP